MNKIDRKIIDSELWRQQVWIICMFDLPTSTRLQRGNASRFRTSLLKDGFNMMQFSVYSRPCQSIQAAEKKKRNIELSIPSNGNVRILQITNKQWEKMSMFFGKKEQLPENFPSQYALF